MTPIDAIAYWANQVNLKDLPETDPKAVLGRTCEAIFTDGIHTLRSIFPNDRIQALARTVWGLVGHKQVLVAIGPDIASLSFTVMKLKGVLQGIVLIPKHWPDLVKEDTFMQVGALIFIGSQVVDFYNDRLIGDTTAVHRWNAYEAEFLRTIQLLMPDWKPNDHQRAILEKYPDGLDSPGVDLYDFKGYEPARGSA